MASIYDGTDWTTYRLTNNMNPDLAPVVSVAGDKVFVAYRSLYNSNLDNPLDFSASDSIVYTVYDKVTQRWSEVETLYNGSNGTVMGMSTAALSHDNGADATAAIVYTVNNGDWKQYATDDYVAAEDNEVIYTVVNLEDRDPDAGSTIWHTKGVVKNLQITNDRYANENPQITSVTFTDDVERFVVAWHTTQEVEGTAEHDIKLLAINRDGEIYNGFIDSMAVLQDYNAVRIHPNFSFVRMPSAYRTIDNLSLLWKEVDFELIDTELVSRDMIKAIKFGIDKQTVDDEIVYLSGVIDVATMSDYTEVDMVDAYVSQSSAFDYEIKALILGTAYTTEFDKIGEITLRNPDEEGEKVPVVISEELSAMYTATQKYVNKFNADEIMLSPYEIVIGHDLPIQFALVNQGISKIDTVTIDVGGQKTIFDDVSLMPNSGRMMVASYTVPSLITNVDYIIEVNFSNGEVLIEEGILTLDIPDLGISTVKIMEEAGGIRQLSIPIYNKNDTTLSHKGRVVKFGLYSNTIYTDEYLIGDIISISNDDDLWLIDQGAYTKRVMFNIKDYLTILDLAEIPNHGITIFLHGWVEDDEGNVIQEFDESNNDGKVWFEHLGVKYKNENILLTLEQTNTVAATSVDVTLQNMNMAPVASGNVVLHLLAADGDVIESQYVATSADGLLEFDAEEKIQETVQFGQTGDAVQAMFYHESADELDATLSSAAISGIHVGFDPLRTSYALEARDLKEVQIQAVATNNQATVSLLDNAGNTVQSNQGHLLVKYPLLMSSTGTVNEFKIVVEAESDAAQPNEYQFEIMNTETSQPQLQLQVAGTMTDTGQYVGEVVLSLPSYELSGFLLDQAMIKINDDAWQTVSYDGAVERELTKLSDVGEYTVMAKVRLVSGSEYALDPVKFTIKAASRPSNGSEPIPSPYPDSEETNSEDQPDHELFRSDIINFGELRQAIMEKLQSTEGSDHQSFIDTERHWALKSIDTLVRLGTVEGYSDGSFRPDNAITRAEFVSMVARLFAIQDQGDIEQTFTDTEQHWANQAIMTLAKHGVINGYSTGEFRPDETISREDAVAIMMRLLDMTALPQDHPTDLSDLGQAGAYARTEIEAATSAGLINGYEDGTFRPQGQTTRAEVVTMLLRLLQLDEETKEMLANH